LIALAWTGIRVRASFIGGYTVEVWRDGSLWETIAACDHVEAGWVSQDLLTHYWIVEPEHEAYAYDALDRDAACIRWREDVDRWEYNHVPSYRWRYDSVQP